MYGRKSSLHSYTEYIRDKNSKIEGNLFTRIGIFKIGIIILPFFNNQLKKIQKKETNARKQ